MHFCCKLCQYIAQLKEIYKKYVNTCYSAYSNYIYTFFLVHQLHTNTFAYVGVEVIIKNIPLLYIKRK